MNKLFEDKVALITGGSSGIGRATALAFAAEGARVAIGARRAEEGEETARLVREQGGDALFVQTDVRHSDQLARLVETAVARWGRLDCACNNAGIEGPLFIPTADYSEDAWNEIIATNLTGVFLAMKHEIPPILKQGGAIVNISSIAGLVGGFFNAAYFASKHGIVGLTKAAAIEYAKSGLRVNAVCPAVIETAMARRAFSDMWERIVDAHPVGRIGTPQEVANTVVWLCSERASFITGHALPVDGGFVAH